MDKRVSKKNRCITVSLHHDGVFIVSLFEYAFGDEKQITDIHFEDSDVDEFVNFGHRNKWQVNLYVQHSGYDALDIRDQEEIMADDGNESSDAYFSSDEEELSYVDFHTEVDDNVIIKNVTTNDLFLNKLCPNSAHFLNVVDKLMFANDETVVEDSENIDPKFNVKSGVTYIRHDPNQYWKKMEPVLGMRNDWRKFLVYCVRDVEAGRCAGWIAHHYTKQLIEDPFIPTLKIKIDIREKFLTNVSLGQWSTCRLDDEDTESGHYYFRRMYVCFKGVKEGWLASCRKVIRLDGCFLKHTCRGELLAAMGRDANNQRLHLETGEGLTIISDSYKTVYYAEIVEMNRVARNWDHTSTPSIRKRLELLKIAQSCKKEPVPKPPKVPRPPAPRTVYGTHASVRVRGRGSRGGRGDFRGRGEGSENIGESSTTEMSQRGRGMGQRRRGSGERGR
nr:hypothetical protein [Tanacetum cinerariifolium]